MTRSTRTGAAGPLASTGDTATGEVSGQIGWPTWRLAWVIVFGAFASGLDASLVNVGVSTIGAALRAGLPVVQWVATGYLLALAASLPLAGWLGRRIGVGQLWLAALAGFTVASLGCAIAPSIQALIGLRVLQGMAGGLLIPAGQTILGQAVGTHRLGRVMATLGIAVTVAPALGPVIGGLLLHATSWRWLFAINLPIGVVGFMLGLRYIPRDHRRAALPLDWPALVCISVGLPLIVYGLTAAAGSAPAWQSGGPLVAGAVGLSVFVVRSIRSRHPILDLALFRRRAFAAATVASGLTGMILFGSGLLFPLYFQLGRHDTILATGLHLLGLGGSTALVLPLVGRLVDRYGGGPISVVGTVLVAATSIPFALLPASANPFTVHALLGVFGAAVALAAVPPGIAAYKTVDPPQLPDATTTVNIVQRIGGALGGSLFTLILANSGFHAAFSTMAAASAAAVLATVWLARAAGPERPAGGRRPGAVNRG